MIQCRATEASLLGPCPAYAALLPHAATQDPWQSLLRPLFNALADLPVVWTEARGGAWRTPRECLLPDAACR